MIDLCMYSMGMLSNSVKKWEDDFILGCLVPVFNTTNTLISMYLGCLYADYFVATIYF